MPHRRYHSVLVFPGSGQAFAARCGEEQRLLTGIEQNWLCMQSKNELMACAFSIPKFCFAFQINKFFQFLLKYAVFKRVRLLCIRRADVNSTNAGAGGLAVAPVFRLFPDSGSCPTSLHPSFLISKLCLPPRLCGRETCVKPAEQFQARGGVS